MRSNESDRKNCFATSVSKKCNLNNIVHKGNMSSKNLEALAPLVPPVPTPLPVSMLLSQFVCP